MIPLANEDAAAFGRPGRTLMVGSLSTRPSTNPLRVQSQINSSADGFLRAVQDRGLTAVVSPTIGGRSPP